MKRDIGLNGLRFCVALVSGILIFVAAISTFAADSRRPVRRLTIGETFRSPDSAAEALAAAVKTKDRAALKAVLGPESDELQMSDQAQADQELDDFTAAFDASHRVVSQRAVRNNAVHRATLEV